MRILFFLLAYLSLWISAEAQEKLLVSISPYKYFIEKIAGHPVDVRVMVPAGASAHTFEPNAHQMLQASESDIWFRLGESFEDQAIAALRSHRPDLEIVDLRIGLDMINVGCCQREGQDLHIWLSPRLAKQQAQTITQALIKRYPQNREQYEKGLLTLSNELDTLDREIKQILQGIKNKTIMVSHPAYGYFSREYGLKQLPVEIEGKDPSPKQLTHILEEARKSNIKVVFIQTQLSNKGAQLIAKEIGAKVVTLDPYAENFIANMKHIAHSFAEGG